MQAGIRELHLRLDPDRARDTKPIRTVGKVVQQCGFPDPRVTAQNHDAAVAVARVCQELVERPALAAPTAQAGPAALCVQHADWSLCPG